MSAHGPTLITPTSTATRTVPSPRTGGIPGTSPPRVLSPNYPDVLALREAKQVALRSARVPFGATRSAPGVVIGLVWRTGTSGGPARSVDCPSRLYSDGSASRRSPTAVSAPRPPAPIRAPAHQTPA